MLLTEPLKWGMRVAVIDLQLARTGAAVERHDSAHSHLLNANTVDEDPAVVAPCRPGTTTVVDYVNR